MRLWALSLWLLMSLLSVSAYAESKAQCIGRNVKLASYDSKTWTDFIDRALDREFTEKEIAKTSSSFKEMPADLKSLLIARIGAVYPKARKNKVTTQKEYSPKRALDAFLSQLIEPQALFAKRKNVITAYQTYLSKVQSALPRPQYGQYGVEQVLQVARGIQTTLKHARRIVQTPPYTHGKEPAILIKGSFPNGRAVLHQSDLDLVFTHRDLAFYTRDYESAVTDAFHETVPLEVGRPYSFSQSPEDDLLMAQPSPVMIRITASKIEVLVYPVKTEADLGRNAKPQYPAVYLIPPN